MIKPLQVLLHEKSNRPNAVRSLKTHIGSTSGKAEGMEWLTDEQKKRVADKCKEIDAWLSNLLIEQEKLQPHQNPVLTLKLIEQKRRELDVVCVPILNTPKPAPPKPKEPEKTDEQKKADA